MMKPYLFLFAAFLSCVTMGSVQAQVVSGGWEVEYDGKSTCMMSSEYNAGDGFNAAVSIGLFREGMALAFVSERWNMTAGEVAKVRMKIDRSWDQWVKVEAQDSETLLILFEHSRELLDAIARGSRIYLNDGKENWSFTLHGTSRAIPEVMDCARRHVW